MHLTIPEIMFLATAIIGCVLVFTTNSIFISCVSMMPLLGASIMGFIISPLLGFRHFALSEYAFLIIPFILCLFFVIYYIWASYDYQPKKDKTKKQ